MANGGEYFVGSGITVADLRVLALLRFVGAGSLDHIPADLAQPYPRLQVRRCSLCRQCLLQCGVCIAAHSVWLYCVR